MVARLDLVPGALVLDVASGTGSIATLLERLGCRVVALDRSREMLSHNGHRWLVEASAEQLPFPDACFDAVTFGYLIRYVADPVTCLRELVRVIRSGGTIGMVEFGRPSAGWRIPWLGYTRLVLPLAGRLIGSGWAEVGSFLGPSIDQFHRRLPGDGLARVWEQAGLVDIRSARKSLGGGLLMWASKP
jgi:demethylmenaquinone methyltransferase/2-methoxy-6-polyprenyl-1,4-benzoquinol methylase